MHLMGFEPMTSLTTILLQGEEILVELGLIGKIPQFFHSLIKYYLGKWTKPEP